MVAINLAALNEKILTGRMSFEAFEETFGHLSEAHLVEIMDSLFSDNAAYAKTFINLLQRGHDPKKMVSRACKFIAKASESSKYDSVFKRAMVTISTYESRPRSYSHRSYSRRSYQRPSTPSYNSRNSLAMASISPSPTPAPIPSYQSSGAEGIASAPPTPEKSIEGAPKQPHEEPYVEGVPAPGYEHRAEEAEPGAPVGEPEPMEDEFEPGLPMVHIAPGGPSVPVEGKTSTSN